ncbi:MAG: GNAT family N-acetyltransferase [Alphaproteobacteria bacterium]|nr:GNAT family N-acetyltransferase [Alphaproteobacteria bacterium]
MKVETRPLTEADLPAARICNRTAFSTFYGMPDPSAFRRGADVIGPRWRVWPEGAMAVDVDGSLAAVGLMMHWGSVCILGPLTVLPKYWNTGLARRIMTALVEVIEHEDFAFTGLFTHPQSPTHIRLYEDYGFVMQRIIAVMAKPPMAEKAPVGLALFSEAADPEGELDSMQALTHGIEPGLDLRREVRSIAAGGLGETLILRDDRGLAGFAVCHHGPDSEASEGQMLVKFAGAASGAQAPDRFARLLAAIESHAEQRNLAKVIVGTNVGRSETYRIMQDAGYITEMNGIAMMRPAAEGYNRPEKFAIDDWR